MVVGDSGEVDAVGAVPDETLADVNSPSLSDPRQLKVILIELRCKVRRDRCRAEAQVPCPPLWALVANQWAEKIWKHILGIGRQVIFTRALLDKHKGLRKKGE